MPAHVLTRINETIIAHENKLQSYYTVAHRGIIDRGLSNGIGTERAGHEILQTGSGAGTNHDSGRHYGFQRQLVGFIA